MSTPSWGIVMTAREPGDLVLANVAYHLGLGASEAHVYLDDPVDPAAARLRGLSGVTLTLCDAAHWASLARGRPEGQNRRQGLNATQAYRRAGVDWLIHLDADEFLRPRGDFLAELAAFPRGFGYLSVPPAERVQDPGAMQATIFDGGFRRPARVPPRLHRALYGPAAAYLEGGMSSHTTGKAFTPTGYDYNIRIHRPRAAGQDKLPAHSALRAHTVELLHFDGLTPLHWLVKLLRYGEQDEATLAQMNAAHRLRQIAECLETTDPAAARALHDRVQGFDGETLARLRALGLYDDTPFDPAPVIARVLPDVPPDLTAQGFDAALRRAYAGNRAGPIATLLASWPS
ncbi:glycosyltransferase family 2 protein [Marimonas lutisalis]|uniref:glycosyltransferase family 2 protein n=1 Tax=Marimonas lutisalis TaxID=2545756 RepID=UPI0010F92942|nr:glycosyltransferase family 2 protein [Marimonas lutisalis]